jgi:hypothetical protein
MTLLQAAHGVTPAKRCHDMTTVYQQHGTWADLFGEPQRLREQVPFVVVAELLALENGGC